MALLSAGCAQEPLKQDGPPPEDRDLQLALRLQDLVETDQLLQPDHTSAPRTGDWRFVYRQRLYVDPDRPCEPSYRMTLDGAREGLDSPQIMDCSGSGGRRCSTVTLSMSRLSGIEVHPREGSAEDEPDAWWLVLDFDGGDGPGVRTGMHLEHAFLTTSDSRHYLLEETVRSLARVCGAGPTGEPGA